MFSTNKLPESFELIANVRDWGLFSNFLAQLEKRAFEEGRKQPAAETIAFHKLQLALEYARNHLANPENTVMPDLFADINEALALAEQVRPIRS